MSRMAEDCEPCGGCAWCSERWAKFRRLKKISRRLQTLGASWSRDASYMRDTLSIMDPSEESPETRDFRTRLARLERQIDGLVRLAGGAGVTDERHGAPR